MGPVCTVLESSGASCTWDMCVEPMLFTLVTLTNTRFKMGTMLVQDFVPVGLMECTVARLPVIAYFLLE